MEKEVLEQYMGTREEIKDLRGRIDKMEKEISQMESESVQDVVSGGLGGIQHFKIDGIPDAARRNKIIQKKRLIATMEEKESLLLELMNDVEGHISSIKQADLRMIFRYRYIDGMTWVQVSINMNSMFPKRVYTDESCRKRHDRFLLENP